MSAHGESTKAGAAPAVLTAFRNELRKIFWRKKYCAMLVIYAVIGLGFGILGASGLSLRAIAMLSPIAVRQNVVYGALSAYRAALLPLAIFMLAADVFTHELETKSIKCVLTRPVSRLDAYLAKSLAILCYAAVALAVCFVAAQAWQAIAPAVSAQGVDAARPGLSDQPVLPGLPGQPSQPGQPSAAAGQGAARSLLSARGAREFAEGLAAYALTLVPMAAFVALASFLAVVVHSPALVMFLCIAAYGALTFAGTFLGGFAPALFTTYTSWYRMWLGDRLPLRSLLSAVGLLSSTCVILFGFGYLVFDRKDI